MNDDVVLEVSNVFLFDHVDSMTLLNEILFFLLKVIEIRGKLD